MLSTWHIQIQKFFMEVELGYSIWPNIKAYI